eukprot:CAMPEP_0197595366 /NCGR_PEP_ID=MMETSP1326-20131121/22717_1 /TAXON_ID=1155430 /ORGANISM="Genus nov. species nov., Strain RCC2288" /LENGTH=240 /DNA_ID=CAMNT_0043161713 /DNA_START=202 /DNA_END=920 /DNA_ORIENTATION=+
MATSSPAEVHVLLVDDERITRMVVGSLLRKCGYQVTTAESGREALALLERGTHFNLLLTDVMMPDIDGPALLHYVRNNQFYQEMPVVMMSSNEHADVVLNCIRLGAEDYLLKPVTKKAVKHMWAHVWRRKQRYQMVPRFENGQEVVDDDELYDHQRQNDAEMDGMLPVPSTEEYSSDGGSDAELDNVDNVAGGAAADDDAMRMPGGGGDDGEGADYGVGGGGGSGKGGDGGGGGGDGDPS